MSSTLTSSAASSAATPSAGAAPRTYGNWRRPTSPGLPRLGLLGTAAALSSLVLVMFVQISAGLLPAAVVATLCVAGVAPLAWRNRAGRNGWQVLLAKAAWRLGRRRRQHLYRSALVSPIAFGATRLPGLLASTRLLRAVTAHGEQFALIALPSTRHYAVLIRCDPEGSQLVDVETVDEWVASWGGWLASLGHEASLEACTVTIETAPDPGSRLAAEVDSLLTADAPALSRAVLTEAAASYPRGSAAVTAYVTLTFTARTRAHREAEGLLGATYGKTKGRSKNVAGTAASVRVRSEQEMAAQIGRRLPLLLHQLRTAGAGTGRAMTAAEVIQTVRVAYDPGCAPLLDRASAAQDQQHGPAGLVDWASAGPAGQVEAWDHLRHDSGASITWQMVDPPHGAVTCRVLEQLLEAHDSLARKRVTLIYRPHDPASAAQVADADVRTAIGRATARPGESRAAETLALTAARQAAAEQAAGAGLVRFSLLVTATVTDPAQLGQAGELIDQLGPACQLRLRRCYGSQAAAFTAALGVGVVLPHHVAVPDLVRDNL
ncbi:MAG: hypothetical protein F2825_00265 [Actinobacteria bacterium]|uniref:Unannotated protein n=1 Tax=freshwater metagenome TaxID=449393 RepID=A0A6J7FRK5_9ZZZZ|nr:hypothetical protein [Actinomycetota bacterium]